MPVAPTAPEPLGLTAAEVDERVAQGKSNTVHMPTSRSLGRIVRSNVFTWFNLILGSLFVLMVLFGNWRDCAVRHRPRV